MRCGSAGGGTRTYVYEEIERQIEAGIAEEDAVAAVQVRLEAHAKAPRSGEARGRKSGVANWKGLAGELQAARPRKVTVENS